MRFGRTLTLGLVVLVSLAGCRRLQRDERAVPVPPPPPVAPVPEPAARAGHRAGSA